MHKKLEAFLNQYLIIGTTIGNLNAYYRARLLEVTPDYFEMELFSKEGLPQGRFIAPTHAITSMQADNRELRELSLNIAYQARSKEAVRL